MTSDDAIATVWTDVVVVGAGPAGLTASALLARAGVDAITFTKYGTANSPRAHITNQRAMEVFRDLGVEDAVRARALPHHLMGKQVFATSFAGRELSRMMTWGTGDDRIGEYRAASPTEMCNIAQHVLEPILLEHARGLGADVRLHHEVLAVDQDDEHVRVRVRPRQGGAPFDVFARYAIGCDGANTVVGRDGGFDYDDRSGLGNAITVWIEADLERYTRHRSGALFVVCNPGSDDLLSVWTCIEPWNEWSTIFIRHGMEPNELDEASVMPRVRAAIGDDDVDVRIKHVSPWTFRHEVATGYRRGRLLIAGDAAHRHPPANGLGSNTSVQDAANLAWKLALVVSGRAGDALLDSYDAERQPVGRQVVDRANQSVGEMATWLAPLGLHPGLSPAEARDRLDHVYGPDGAAVREQLLAGLEVMNAQFNAHGVETNQRYESSAVVGDGTPFPPFERDPELHHQATAHPGAPLPHAWIGLGDREVSTLDLCAYDRFTLITGADGEAWVDAAAAVAAATGVPIAVVPVGLGLAHNDVLGTWTRIREVTDRGCVLVRPDRIVAWRAAERPADPRAALAGVFDRLLDRHDVPVPEPMGADR